MRKIVPKYCRPEAFALLLDQLDCIDRLDALVRGAVAIAMHELGEADLAAVDAELDRLAGLIRSRVRGTQVGAVLAHAHHVLFDEEGFTGDTDDYYNPRNSYLPIVLQTRKGLPISLCLIYKAVLERVGIKVLGINAPVHFLAGVEASPGGASMLIDPFFNGRLLSRREALDQIQSLTGAVETEEVLAPASHRQWLARMARNLEGVFARADRYNDVSAMIEIRAVVAEDE